MYTYKYTDLVYLVWYECLSILNEMYLVYVNYKACLEKFYIQTISTPDAFWKASIRCWYICFVDPGIRSHTANKHYKYIIINACLYKTPHPVFIASVSKRLSIITLMTDHPNTHTRDELQTVMFEASHTFSSGTIKPKCFNDIRSSPQQ